MKPTYGHIINRVQFAALLLVTVTLVCPIRWNAYALLAFCFISLLNFSQLKNYKSQNPVIQLLLLLYFLLHFTFYVFDQGNSSGYEVERKLALVFLPLFLLNESLVLSETNKRQVKQLYILSVFCAAIICLVLAFFNYSNDGNTAHFYYHALCKPIGQHAVYFSVHVLIAMVFSYQFIEEKRQPMSNILLLIFFFILLLLLSSKTIFCCFVILFLFFFFKKFRRQHNFKKLSLLLALSVLVLTLSLSGNLSKRFGDISLKRLELLKQDQYNPGTYFDGLVLRLVQLKFGMQLLNENEAWLTGVGPDAQQLLDKKYTDHNMYRGLDLKSGYLGLNFHNQYAETLVRLGVFGFIILLLIIIYSFKHAAAQKNTLLLAVLFIFSLFFLTESVLETQRGLLAFTFFICFLTRGIQKV